MPRAHLHQPLAKMPTRYQAADVEPLAPSRRQAHLGHMPARNLAPAETLPVRSCYSLQRWRTRAKHQLRVDPLCCLCMAKGEITPATIADHSPPHGGDYTLFLTGPLRSLCKPHHDGLQPSFRHKGYRLDIGVDGCRRA